MFSCCIYRMMCPCHRSWYENVPKSTYYYFQIEFTCIFIIHIYSLWQKFDIPSTSTSDLLLYLHCGWFTHTNTSILKHTKMKKKPVSLVKFKLKTTVLKSHTMFYHVAATTLFLVLELRTILYDCWQQGWERATEVTPWKNIDLPNKNWKVQQLSQVVGLKNGCLPHWSWNRWRDDPTSPIRFAFSPFN